MTNTPQAPSAVAINLAALSEGATTDGPQWGHESEDLNLTLLSWSPGHTIAPHVNTEVDVVIVAVAGSGEVVVNGETLRLQPGQALLIPKGSARAIRSTEEHFSYLSIHRRRRGLWPTVPDQMMQSE